MHLEPKCMQLHTQGDKMENLLEGKKAPSDLFWPKVLLWSKSLRISFLCPSPDVLQVPFHFPAVSLRVVSAGQVLPAEVSFSDT